MRPAEPVTSARCDLGVFDESLLIKVEWPRDLLRCGMR